MIDPRDIGASSELHDDKPLERGDLLDDPIRQVGAWLADAEAAGIVLPNAVALATTGADLRPSVRHVLLRGIDDRGFVFYTNYGSRKGRQLSENPHAALACFWRELDRQVTATGHVTRVSEQESDDYFTTRPRDAQLGAWASRQSEVIAERGELESAVAAAEARFPGLVPRPPHWGGFRLAPDIVELWQGRRHRLHDRFRYSLEAAGWRIERLSP
jgi:pyridoxamine 5'-phosphate oxidase